MTDPASPQPQREYIITEGDLNCIEQLLGRKSNLIQAIRTRPHTPAPETFATKAATDDLHVCYPNCVKFETKRCPYPGSAVRRDTCNCFRSDADDHYVHSLIFGVYNYPKEIERIVKEHDAAIARAATLATIPIIEDAIGLAKVVCMSNVSRDFVLKEKVSKLEQRLESLRQSTTAAQEDRR